MMIDSYCGGRLRRAVEQVEVTTWGDSEPVFTPGRDLWLWDGQEIEPVVAQAYLVLWCSGADGVA